jgi:hypothetical protein
MEELYNRLPPIEDDSFYRFLQLASDYLGPKDWVALVWYSSLLLSSFIIPYLFF